MRKDPIGTEIGTVSISPDGQDIVVGKRYQIHITYTAGSKGVEIGGTLRFKLPGHYLHILNRSKQNNISCSNPNVKLICSDDPPEINGKKGFEILNLEYMFHGFEIQSE